MHATDDCLNQMHGVDCVRARVCSYAYITADQECQAAADYLGSQASGGLGLNFSIASTSATTATPTVSTLDSFGPGGANGVTNGTLVNGTANFTRHRRDSHEVSGVGGSWSTS